MSAFPFAQFSDINVDEYTTPCPIVINSQANISDAITIMQEHDIRHLPVVAGRSVVGIISDRDTRIAAAANLHPRVQVSDVMQPPPYPVDKNTPLLDVVFYMSEHKIRSAIVTDGEKMDGISTTTDALNALVDVLKQ